jgi:hypothetical protein
MVQIETFTVNAVRDEDLQGVHYAFWTGSAPCFFFFPHAYQQCG